MNRLRDARGSLVNHLFAAWALLMIGLTAAAIASRPVSATPTIGGGDCWKAGTPLLCRVTWQGAGQLMLMKVINQLGTDYAGVNQLWPGTTTAYQNWNVPQGAQSFRDYGRTNDSWVYMKRNDAQGCNGYTVNYNSNNVPSAGPISILWSEIFLSAASATVGCGPVHIPIASHELGHTLGLDHSSNASSVMKQGTTLTAPNVSSDIAQDQACIGEKGVSCIYATN